MKRILAIEDEKNIRELLRFNFEAQGFAFCEYDRGDGALACILAEKPDLIILDLMLPGQDGLAVLREIRSLPETAGLPVMLLTAKGEEFDKVLGLEMGADDYVVKPFSVKELIARAKAVMRRQRVVDQSKKDIVIGDLRISPEAYEVYLDGTKVELSLKEFELLYTLAKNRNKAMGRNELLDKIWGENYFGETRTLDVHIRFLRKKLEGDERKFIETVRGVGYRLVDGGAGA